MAKGGVEIPVADRCTGRILVEHVREDVEGDGLQGDLSSLGEFPGLVEREINLAKEHRLRGGVEWGASGKAALGVARTKRRSGGPHGQTQEVFRGLPERRA